MPATPIRYAPLRAFPAYAFLPGRDPHPTGDPRGHSYTTESHAPPPYFEASAWRDNEEYLFGVDLYNHGYLWEAHEAWEGLWHQAKHDTRMADFLQGLIQCSAAALKIAMRQPRGLERLAELGTERLERASRESRGQFMGLDVSSYVRAWREFAGSAPESADARPRIVLDL